MDDELVRGTGSGSRYGWCRYGLVAAAIAVAVLDVVHVLRTWWMGSDVLPTVRSVAALFHGHPIDPAYVYPPGLLVLSWPFALLQHGRHAEDLVLFVEVLGLAFAFWAMARLAGIKMSSAPIAGLALLLGLSGQLVFGLQLENLTLLLVPLATAFYWLLSTKHWMAAGLVLGVSFTVKPMLLPLIAILLLERRWRATVAAIAVPVVTSALALAVSFQLHHFVQAARGLLSGNDHSVSAIDLSAASALWHVNGAVVGATRVLVVLATIAITRRIWTNGELPVRRFVWTGEVMLAGLLVVSEFTHGFYVLVLLPVAFVAVTEERIAARWIALVGMLLMLMPYGLATAVGPWPGDHRLQVTSAFVGMILIVVAGAVVGRRRGEAESGLVPAVRTAAVSRRDERSPVSLAE